MKRPDSYPKTTAGAGNNPYGLFNNESTPGAQDQTPIDAGHPNDLFGAFIALLVDQGVVPNGSLENTANSDFLTALKSAIGKVDITYLVPTVGTEALTQATVGTYTYSIADFGAGIDTDEIRGVYIACNCPASGGTNSIFATYPDGTELTICEAQGLGAGDNVSTVLVAYVPVISGQTSFNVRIAHSGTSPVAEFTIVGVAQRTLP